MKDKKFDEVVTHLQVSGYVFPGSQIYGGLSNSWDYGPLGVLIKNNVKNLTFEVAGIFEVKEDEDKKSYEQSLVSSSAPIIADAAYLINNVPSLYYTSLDYYHNVTKTNFNSSELTDKLDGLVNALSDTLPNNDPRWKNVSCYALDDLKMSSLIGTIIIGFASFLCLVLILLSIGSLANQIMISVDKNKKFIGLLKAVG